MTHLDDEGNDSPAILIDNATAANRAVNIPEFVNIPPDGMMKIDVPAAESYRLFDRGVGLDGQGPDLNAAIAEWKKVLELDPRNAKAHNNLGVALQWQGNLAEGTAHLQKALELDPSISEADTNLGIAFYYREQFRAAIGIPIVTGLLLSAKRFLPYRPTMPRSTGLLGIARCIRPSGRCGGR